MAELKKHDKSTERKVDGQYIVVFKDHMDNDIEADRIVKEHGVKEKHRFGHAIKGFAAKLNEHQLEKLLEDPAVEYIEEDVQVQVQEAKKVVAQPAARKPPPTPHPYIQPPAPVPGSQAAPTNWGLDRIGQRALPLDGQYNYPATGKGITVYVIDSGVRDTHQEFGNRAITVFDALGVITVNSDCYGHGTHVAGTIAGGTTGVAKEAMIRACRVIDCTGGVQISSMIAAINYISANYTLPCVASMSIGASGLVTALDDAVRALALQIPFVVAAGNWNYDASQLSPSSVTEAIVVAATDVNDTRPSYSDFGTNVDLFAPGVSIYSAIHTNDNDYGYKSGTSMACPHVSGAVAVYLQTNPTATVAQVLNWLVNNATTGVVQDPQGSPNRLLYVG